MKYFIQGKGAVQLSQNEFIAKGGEGEVYGKDDTIYKIYLDPSKMIPEAKIRELQALTRPNILKPGAMILDPKNKPVGFCMDWIKDTIPLCKFFTNDFRHRVGVTDDSTAELTENMKDTIQFIHQSSCLIVDGNEFNYLVNGKDWVTPFFIDVDSYQTPNFPATAIMPSIRDWHSKAFSALTDWFSFAVIACQLFVGIHPFKGSHPDYKKNELERRMKDNISIFNPKVRVPPTARDFSKIPSEYLAWFIDLFEKGKRLAPPKTAGQLLIMIPKITVIQSTDNFDISLLKEFENDLLWYFRYAGMNIAAVQKKIFMDKTGYSVSHATDIVFTTKMQTPVFASISDGYLKLSAIGKSLIPFADMKAQDKMIVNNTLYVRHEGNLIEMNIDDVGDKVLAVVKNVWNIMPHSAEMFAGIVYQSVLGKPYLVIPQPKKDGASTCIIKAVPELENCRIIDAKHDSGVCILIAFKENAYRRVVLKFDEQYDTYDCRMTEDIDPGTVNFITLDNGIVISIHDDGALEIFSKRADKPDVNLIRDPDIDASMRLCKDANRVLFFKGNKLYSLSMVKTKK